MSKALLASLMLAIAADVVGSIDILASVANTFDPQTNFLFDPLNVRCRRPRPFTRTDCQAIFSKENTGFLLLYGAIFGRCLRKSCVGGSQISDRLLDVIRFRRNRGRRLAGNSCILGVGRSTVRCLVAL